MTLGELRKLTSELPDNVPLLTPLPSYGYKVLIGHVTTACPAPCDFDPSDGVRRLSHGSCGAEQTVVVLE
jgi:hypothetical protein